MYKQINPDRKIKLAAVGCGRISKRYFDSIEQDEGEMELVAVCDVDAAVMARGRIDARYFQLLTGCTRRHGG